MGVRDWYISINLSVRGAHSFSSCTSFGGIVRVVEVGVGVVLGVGVGIGVENMEGF